MRLAPYIATSARDSGHLVLGTPAQFDRDEDVPLQHGLSGVQQLRATLLADPAVRHVLPRVAFTGSYAFPPYFRRYMEQDMTRSTLLSVGAVLLLFGLFFRSLRILPVVLLPLALAGLWTAVAAALLFGRISAVSMAFATILVAIGIDVPIQLYNRLREELGRDLGASAAQGKTAHDVARETICLLAGPSVVATLGPAAVFFCCGLSDFRGLNQLGILAGVGLCLNCVAMLTVFPALLLVLPTRLWLGKPQPARARRSGLLAALGRVSMRWPRTVLLTAAALFALAVPLMLRAGLGKELLSMDLGAMPPALTQQEVSRRFGEHQRFLVALIEDSDPARALERADLWLDAVEKLRQRGALRGYEALGTLVRADKTQAHRRQRLHELDGLNQFLYLIETAGLGATSMHHNLMLAQVYPDFALDVDEVGVVASHSFNGLDSLYLEPERTAITEMADVDFTGVKSVPVNRRLIFSKAELENNLAFIAAAYAEFNLHETSFGQLAAFIRSLLPLVADEYFVRLTAKRLDELCSEQKLPDRKSVV